MGARLAGALAGVALTLVAVDTVPPTSAQTSRTLPVTPELVLSVDGFDTFYTMVMVGHKPGFEILFFFFSGLRTTLMATSQAYVAGGAKPRICIPPDVETDELFNATQAELERNPSYLKTNKEGSIVPIALQAFARKWPCQ